jgi:hypothetical protein
MRPAGVVVSIVSVREWKPAPNGIDLLKDEQHVLTPGVV